MLPVRTAAALLTALLLTGCTSGSTRSFQPPPGVPTTPVETAPAGPIELGSPALPPAEQAACEALLAQVAGGLADRPARTDVAPGLGAAYGDPALVLRCGVGVPEGFDPTEVPDEDDPPPCTIVSGVGWYVPLDQARGGVTATFTTIGYAPRISVTVPPEAQPEAGAAALAQLASSVKASLERRPLDPTQQGRPVSPCA